MNSRHLNTDELQAIYGLIIAELIQDDLSDEMIVILESAEQKILDMLSING